MPSSSGSFYLIPKSFHFGNRCGFVRSKRCFALLEHFPEAALEALVSGGVVGLNEAFKSVVAIGDAEVVASKDFLGEVEGVAFTLNFLTTKVACDGTSCTEFGLDAV